MKVCFSGTFNILHKGHKHLIDKAFQIAGKNGTVYIGITKGEILKKKKFTKPLTERTDALKEYLSSKGYNKRAVIKEIFDEYGPAADGDYDAIIVSPETFKNAEDLNIKRVGAGKKPLKIVKISYVLAEDKKPISSTRIYENEIDDEGRVIQ